MEDDPLPDVLGVEHLAKAGDKYNGKFQAFAFVDAHNTHNVFCPFSFGQGKIHVIFLQLLHVADKVEQSAVAGALIGYGFFYQHFQVCTFYLASWEGIDIILITRFF